MPRIKKSYDTQAPDAPERVLGAIIREKRIALGLQQADLESASDLDQGHISRIESGKTQIGLRAIVQIAEALKTTSGALLTEMDRRIKRISEGPSE